MANLAPFVQHNKLRINKFLNDLCEVSDFYDTLEMDQYVALSKKDLELSISLNEVYSTHALLEKHAATLVSISWSLVCSTRERRLTNVDSAKRFHILEFYFLSLVPLHLSYPERITVLLIYLFLAGGSKVLMT